VNREYTYKGIKYNSDLQREDEEVSKYYHTVTFELPTGKSQEKMMDWSSYSTPTEEQFQAWVDLGMPKRSGIGPLNEKDLMKMLQERK